MPDRAQTPDEPEAAHDETFMASGDPDLFQPPPDKVGLGTLARVFHDVRPFWPEASWLAPIIILLGIFASLAESIGVAVIIFLLSLIIRGDVGSLDLGEGPVVDAVNSFIAWTDGRLALVAAMAFLLILVRVAAVSAHTIVTTLVEASISDRVRRMLFRGVLSMPLDEQGKRPLGDTVAVFNRHSWAVAEAVDALCNLILNGVIAVFVGLTIVVLSPWIALIALLGNVALTVLLRLVEAPAERAGTAVFLASMRLSTRVARVLQAFRTVRAYGQAGQQARAFDEESNDLRRTGIRGDVIEGLVEPISHITYLGMLAAIAVYAVNYMQSYELALAAVALLYRLQPYITELESQRLSLASILAPLRAVKELCDFAATHAPRGGEPVGSIQGSIRFEGVTFAYPGQQQPCLNRVSFEIPVGRWTAIKGRSGIGKSTIIGLLLRFYDAQAGAILVNGKPLDRYDAAIWLSHIAVAGQDVELIDGTVEENILLAKPEATPDEVERVARMSGLDIVVAQHPDGMSTRVGERGVSFSGGERQRIGIARAILRAPELLILDEATSALDAASEQLIFERLAAEMVAATVIVISHRLPESVPIGHVVDLARDVEADGQRSARGGSGRPKPMPQPGAASPAGARPTGVRSREGA